MQSATTDVISVPIKGERPPSTGSGIAFGAQRAVVMKRKPNSASAGQAPMIREIMIAPSSARTEKAAIRVSQ